MIQLLIFNLNKVYPGSRSLEKCKPSIKNLIRIKMKYFLYFSFFLFSITSNGQTNTTLPTEVVKSIEKRIELGLNPSIVIGIVDKDGMHFFNFGKKSDFGSAADEHTIYEIASITKTFTAILLAQQEIDGKLKIDDPIKNYLPPQVKVPQRGKEEITFGHLSDHTSGLPFNPGNMPNPADYTIDSMYSCLSRCKLKHNVGSAYQYSNLAQGLLGHILALNTGLTYESLMIQTIALPLGMKETKITFDEEMKKNLAIGYYDGIEIQNMDISTLEGCGAIRTSAYDMLKFLAANMGLTQTPLQPAMNKTHEVRHNKGKALNLRNALDMALSLSHMSIGLGWWINNGKKGNVVWHAGEAYGYSSFAGFVKETGKGVVVLANSREPVLDIGLHLLNPVFGLWPVKPTITLELKKDINEKGVEAAKNHFYKLKKSKPNECEGIINTLGYSYMEKNINTALAIFKINVEMYPNSFNVYNSYAEALLKNGQQDLAIENYKKSVEMNPVNSGGIQALEKMGVKIQVEKVEVPEVTLQTYVGTYQHWSGFICEIRREGKQLSIQATGQSRFELYAKTEKEFFPDFNAQITFNTKGKKGAVKSLTLLQNGKKYDFKKIK
jgi:serine-type D-Ala-D-Ala carboxypeptidase/endopeptidase